MRSVHIREPRESCDLRDVCSRRAACGLWWRQGSAAAIIGSLASWALVDGLLGAEFILDGGLVFATTIAGAFVTAILGLAGAMKTLGRKPAKPLNLPH